MNLQPPTNDQPIQTIPLVDSDINEEQWTEELSLDDESLKRVQQRWQQIRCYGFQVGSYNVLAPLNIYCELLTQVRIESLPNTPEHFLGLTNVRGNLVPVYQLEPLLGDKPLRPNYALVIGDLKQAGALLINSKPKPFDLRQFEPCACPSSVDLTLAQATKKHYQFEGVQWHMINHQTLFQQLANHNG